jgi:hypothetical protein
VRHVSIYIKIVIIDGCLGDKSETGHQENQKNSDHSFLLSSSWTL